MNMPRGLIRDLTKNSGGVVDLTARESAMFYRAASRALEGASKADSLTSDLYDFDLHDFD